MKKTRIKVLAVALCLVMVAVSSSLFTIAYLTSTTGTVTNTFTLGKVAITLDETTVDTYGEPIGSGDPTQSNSYKLIPGHTYTKDPTVHVTSGSEVCYLFVKVVNPLASIEKAGNTTIAKQMETNGWVALSGVENVYYLNTTVDARSAQQNKTVFSQVVLEDDSSDWATSYGDITIKAYAVQADGFDTAAAAWTAAAFTD